MVLSGASQYLMGPKKYVPVAPPLPSQMMNYHKRGPDRGSCEYTHDLWERLFDDAYRADVSINTDNGPVIHAHSNILGMASPVMRSMLIKQSGKNHKQSFSIKGVPPDAVRVFIRFLYSSRYVEGDMDEYAVHLLVLSHVFMIAHLKRICERHLEYSLNTDNVVDIFQLALLCDSPRLSFICHRTILRCFKAVSETKGWNAMRISHPSLEKELLVSKIYEEAMRRERKRKMEDRKTYVYLFEAMEAVIHIFRDGCRTIGPRDQVLKVDESDCKFVACNGLELLFRHFIACKLRVPGSCTHCKRMWQLLELHSRLCDTSHSCKVPRCRYYKESVSRLGKKNDLKWKILVKNIFRAKSLSAGLTTFASYYNRN